jgi:uncharacterized Rmd1/YagE family protein
LRARVHDPLEIPETDQIQVRVNPAGEDQIEPSGLVLLADASLDRLQIIANVVSKSLVLGHSEARIAGVFDRIEPLAVGLQRKGRPGAQTKELPRQIGDVLLTQHRMVGRVEVEKSPMFFGTIPSSNGCMGDWRTNTNWWSAVVRWSESSR